MNQTVSRQSLLRQIMEYDFALYDLALYLDTHPEDSDTLEIFHQLKNKSEQSTAEYARLFGPLTFKQVNSENYWTWVSDNWPWEGGCE